MGKTIGRFDYDIYGGPDHKPIPCSPVVEIHLKWWDHSEGGPPLLSPELVTEAEIDGHIQALKDNLDAVGVAAKRALSKRHPAQIKNT